jgi:hypothetical protein
MKHQPPPTFRGRSIGITVLTALQLLIGVIHTVSGAILLVAEDFSALPTTAVYAVYTLVYGLLVLVFAVLFWQGKKAGWIGTAAVLVFVIAVDVLALLDLPAIPGVPKAAGIGEIPYSVLVLAYLVQPHVRKRYLA